MDMAWMSNNELLNYEKDMRTKSHDAPKSLSGSESNAWARFAAAWGFCVDEVTIRGLEMKP